MQKLKRLCVKFKIPGGEGDESRRVLQVFCACDIVSALAFVVSALFSIALGLKGSRILDCEEAARKWINARLVNSNDWRDVAFAQLYSWLVPGIVLVGFLSMIWTFYLLMSSEEERASDIISSGWTCIWFVFASLALVASIFVLCMGWLLPFVCCWIMMLILAIPVAVINKELKG